MGQPILHYLTKGIIISTKALHKSKVGFMRYFFYSMTAIIGKLSFIGTPLFMVSDEAVINQIEDQASFQLEGVLDEAKQHQKYYTLLQMVLLKRLLMVVGFGLIALMTTGFVMFSMALDSYLDFDRYYIAFFFQLTGGILLVLYPLMVMIQFQGIRYLIIDKGLSLSDAAKENKQILSKSAQFKLGVIYLMYLLGLLLFIGLLVGLGFVAYVELFTYAFYLVVTLMVTLALLLLPRWQLALLVTTRMVYMDFLDANYYQTLVNNHKSSADKLRKEAVLNSLFDEVLDLEVTQTDVVESDDIMVEENTIEAKEKDSTSESEVIDYEAKTEEAEEKEAI